jgi:hypothetical protein
MACFLLHPYHSKDRGSLLYRQRSVMGEHEVEMVFPVYFAFVDIQKPITEAARSKA